MLFLCKIGHVCGTESDMFEKSLTSQWNQASFWILKFKFDVII